MKRNAISLRGEPVTQVSGYIAYFPRHGTGTSSGTLAFLSSSTLLNLHPSYTGRTRIAIIEIMRLTQRQVYGRAQMVRHVHIQFCWLGKLAKYGVSLKKPDL